MQNDSMTMKRCKLLRQKFYNIGPRVSNLKTKQIFMLIHSFYFRGQFRNKVSAFLRTQFLLNKRTSLMQN